jgi:hypothetical protein
VSSPASAVAGRPLPPAAQHCRARAGALGRHADGAAPELAAAEIARAYRRLAALFRAELAGFERKRYANLSREPNKAMNLNSHIACLGRGFREEPRADGLHLVPAAPGEATLRVPDADYLLTLDADSLLLPGYALRLVHLMEQPGNERLAVAQTPYSAVPGAPGALERTAGATTDVQQILHQGFTRYGATFWVGANALLRRAALEDIREDGLERGHPVARYIQDRTVIEDTESTVDLVAKGWRLHNYPARLAYSATPPDFGALLIQRRRWANGGLLILPKLLGYVARRPGPRRLAEGFIRVHYLGSLAWGSLGLPLLLLFPFGEAVDSAWLPLTAVPYFALYGRDLVRSGYGWGDLPRVYALNLLLVPVHLGGVLKSLQQAWTGRRTPFGRTPKVRGRTAAPALYVLAVGALLASCVVALASDVLGGRYGPAAFSLVNGVFFGYALAAFVGLGAAVEDVRAGLASRLGRRADARDRPTISVAMKASSRATYLRLPFRLAFSEASGRARFKAIRRSRARFRAALRSHTRLVSSRRDGSA